MAPKFGTSGLRGLVTELTNDLISNYIHAFIKSCPVGTGLYIGRDLRPSSANIAQMVIHAGQAAGLQITDCGKVPTPALALAAINSKAGAVMVTGSHIPADRNGLKFYTPHGEITKQHESAILENLGQAQLEQLGPEPVDKDVNHSYIERYSTAYGNILQGMKIGNYAHSAVGRNITAKILHILGAETVDLGRSETFVPVDTEAVANDLRAQLKLWAKEHQLDAIISTDGDGDRPLVTDEKGQVIPGDILGQITAVALDANIVVTPVSSNTGVELCGKFEKVIRTKIGSPFVIAEMAQAMGRSVGYEANGGFLLGFTADGPNGPIPTLMTRDAILPVIATLAASRGMILSEFIAQQPHRFTAANRLENVPTWQSKELVDDFDRNPTKRAEFLSTFNAIEHSIDQTDGLRIILKDKNIIHLRASGNAPELRLYVEASSKSEAENTLSKGLDALKTMLNHTA